MINTTQTVESPKPNPTRRQVRGVLLLTLGLNLLVAGSKIALGLATGVLAIAADGVHSLADSAGNVAGLIGNYFASQPPDAEHPYGHRRFETLAALFIGGLLLLTAWEVVQSTLERAQTQSAPEIGGEVLGILALTLLVNIGVTTYQTRAGRRLNSEILLADARHTRSDVFVTLSVMASTALVALTGWLWIDIAAALIVVALIGRAGWAILRDTGRVLVDGAPYTSGYLRTIVLALPCVDDVVRVRSRGPLDAAHIDVDIGVSAHMTADQTGHIAQAVTSRLHEHLSGIQEVEVHFIPRREPHADPTLTARAVADALGLATHEVHLMHSANGNVLDLHVEVPPGQTLAQAHGQVSQLEHDLQAALPHLDRITTHIEPTLSTPPVIRPADTARAATLVEQAACLLKAHFPAIGWHDVSACSLRGGFALTLHAVLPPETTVETAHTIAEDAEVLLRARISDLSRVTIHTEPFDHD